MRERMCRGWPAGAPFTVCGNGSLPANTKSIREWLPRACTRYGIKTVNDAGAGDLQWQDRIEWDVEYAPFDLFPRTDDVIECDITAQTLPTVDATICRMVLNHLDKDRVTMALDRLRDSSKYLFATHFAGGGVQRSAQFIRHDLTQWLGEPLEMCRDGTESNCFLALW